MQIPDWFQPGIFLWSNFSESLKKAIKKQGHQKMTLFQFYSDKKDYYQTCPFFSKYAATLGI